MAWKGGANPNMSDMEFFFPVISCCSRVAYWFCRQARNEVNSARKTQKGH